MENENFRNFSDGFFVFQKISLSFYFLFVKKIIKLINKIYKKIWKLMFPKFGSQKHRKLECTSPNVYLPIHPRSILSTSGKYMMKRTYTLRHLLRCRCCCYLINQRIRGIFLVCQSSMSGALFTHIYTTHEKLNRFLEKGEECDGEKWGQTKDVPPYVVGFGRGVREQMVSSPSLLLSFWL